MLPEAGGLGVGVGGWGRGTAPKNRQSQLFPGGLGVRPPPRSICLCRSLCHPACQPGPAQPSPAGWDRRLCQPWPGQGWEWAAARGLRRVLPLCLIFPYPLFAFRAPVFPSPGALTRVCASLWLSRPSLHLCHHLPRGLCQLWAQEASGPVALGSRTHPAPPPG